MTVIKGGFAKPEAKSSAAKNPPTTNGTWFVWEKCRVCVADSPARRYSAPGLVAPLERSISPSPVQNGARFPAACVGKVPNLSEENGTASTAAAKDGNESPSHAKHPPHDSCELWPGCSQCSQVSAPAELYDPGAHSSQLDPELWPGLALYVPVGHKAQLTALELNLPAGHGVHTSAPAALIDPPAQSVHVDSRVACVAVDAFPAAQLEHAETPGRSPHVPAGQTGQSVRAPAPGSGPYRPASQAMQSSRDVLATTVEYFPLGQFAHPIDARSDA